MPEGGMPRRMKEVQDIIDKHEGTLSVMLATKASYDKEFNKSKGEIESEVNFGFNRDLDVCKKTLMFMDRIVNSKLNDTGIIEKFTEYVGELKQWLEEMEANEEKVRELDQQVEILDKHLKDEKEKNKEMTVAIEGMERKLAIPAYKLKAEARKKEHPFDLFKSAAQRLMIARGMATKDAFSFVPGLWKKFENFIAKETDRIMQEEEIKDVKKKSGEGKMEGNKDKRQGKVFKKTKNGGEGIESVKSKIPKDILRDLESENGDGKNSK